MWAVPSGWPFRNDFEMEDKTAAKEERIHELEGDLAQAVSHIKDLERLLREWKRHWLSPHGSKSPDELVDLTEQLLGED